MTTEQKEQREQETRLDCLRLSVSAAGTNPDRVVGLAASFAEFVIGEKK